MSIKGLALGIDLRTACRRLEAHPHHPGPVAGALHVERPRQLDRGDMHGWRMARFAQFREVLIGERPAAARCTSHPPGRLERPKSGRCNRSPDRRRDLSSPDLDGVPVSEVAGGEEVLR